MKISFNFIRFTLNFIQKLIVHNKKHYYLKIKIKLIELLSLNITIKHNFYLSLNKINIIIKKSILFLCLHPIMYYLLLTKLDLKKLKKEGLNFY